MNFKKCVVNGVDINECKYRYYSPSHVECKCEYTTRYGYEITSYDFCRKNPNCYFKQLKRAERECLELKFNEDNFRVDATRAKIKASKYKQALDEIENICQIESENNRYSGACVFKKIIEIIGKQRRVNNG